MDVERRRDAGSMRGVIVTNPHEERANSRAARRVQAALLVWVSLLLIGASVWS